jgi:hypothetical protein
MSIRITLTPVNHSVDFEVGSPEEGISFVTEKGAALTALLDVLDRLPKGDTALATETAAHGEPAKERKPRGPNKPKVDAVAPAPLAIPSAALPAPPAPLAGTAPIAPATAPQGDDMPAFLKRDANNASPAIPAPAAPPPPLAPPAPPVPAAPPPTGVLAEKIIANLDARAKGTPDGGKSIADWLAGPGCGITVPGATYAEAIAVIRMTADAKLEPLLPALGL